jgi:hypothetical protein
MIPLIPYQKLIINSPLSQEEALRRLSLEVAKPVSGWQWLEKRTEKFEGTVSGDDFQISRIIRYRNSFLPIIQGHFSPFGAGVRVEVIMKLHGIVLVFAFLWLSFVGFPVLEAILQALRTGRFEEAAWFPCAMVVLFFLMVTIGFEIEASKARKLLNRIFEADGDWRQLS